MARRFKIKEGKLWKNYNGDSLDIAREMFPEEYVDDVQGEINDINDAIDSLGGYVPKDDIYEDGDFDIHIRYATGKDLIVECEDRKDTDKTSKRIIYALQDRIEFFLTLINEEDVNLSQVKDTFERFQENINKNIDIQKEYVETEIQTIYNISRRMWDAHEDLVNQARITEMKSFLKRIREQVATTEQTIARLQELEGKAEVMRAVLKEVE